MVSGQLVSFIFFFLFEFENVGSFDSVQDGSVAMFTPHTSFEDPTTPKDAPFRESIELRALVFYD